MITLQDVITLYLVLTSKHQYNKYALQIRVECLVSKLEAILIVAYVISFLNCWFVASADDGCKYDISVV